MTLGPPKPPTPHEPDEWIRRFATLPLMHQPGEKWMTKSRRSITRSPHPLEACSVEKKHPVGQDQEGTGALAGHGREGTIERAGTSPLQDLKLNPQGPGRDLDLFQEQWVRYGGGIPEDGYAGHLGDGLLEQLQRFADISGPAK